MTVEYQKWITRKDLQSNPDTLYIFGDNDIRTGYGGQAKEMRGEPNAIGIRTKHTPANYDHSFWRDDDFTINSKKLQEDFKPVVEHIRNGGKVIIPTDGLGTGLADLPNRAPKTFQYLEKIIEELEEMCYSD